MLVRAARAGSKSVGSGTAWSGRLSGRVGGLVGILVSAAPESRAVEHEVAVSAHGFVPFGPGFFAAGGVLVPSFLVSVVATTGATTR